MKRILLILSLFATVGAFAQAVNLPQPSPTQTIKQNFGLGSIELSYSRPALKNRNVFKEGSELAPIDKVWRTGANGATVITFSDDVIINNVAIKPGKYGLLSIPGKKAFTLIITSDLTVNQPPLYKPDNDIVRFSAPIMKLSEKVELFTMEFANITPETCELQLMWGNTLVSLPIVTNIKARVKADIQKSLDGDKPAYGSMANYYFDIEKDNAKALEYITKSISNAKQPNFGSYLLKAKIEKEMGDKASAKTSAQKCIELAITAKNDDAVRAAKELISKL
ncbi:DUF2911 domain-containing protein [Parasediminibacterium sp. JCM 36343]|uniref:DUF2911 domain-containing protein n=1 Tax=Parasediminibacterium sp. JCM 36343 TaxID=3374279 RepID=UPI0039799301